MDSLTVPIGLGTKPLMLLSKATAPAAQTYGTTGRSFITWTLACWYSAARLSRFGSASALASSANSAALSNPNCAVLLPKWTLR